MAKRKELGKKIRFEVFKRDKFTCQYCGRTVPDVILHVDHIKPVAKGGTNDIMNLITSCSDCNLGKGARELSDDSIVKKQQRQIQELADKNEQLEMMLQWREEIQQLSDKEVNAVNEHISSITAWKANDNGKKIIKNLIKEFSIQLVLDAVDIAFDKYYDGSEKGWEDAFNKIGGICYNKTHKNNGSYYFNYLCKAAKNKFGYYNMDAVSRWVNDYIHDEDDFEKVKLFLKTSRNWSLLCERVEYEYEC